MSLWLRAMNTFVIGQEKEATSAEKQSDPATGESKFVYQY